MSHFLWDCPIKDCQCQDSSNRAQSWFLKIKCYLFIIIENEISVIKKIEFFLTAVVTKIIG